MPHRVKVCEPSMCMQMVALLFSTVVASFTIVAELKDIELCRLAVVHAGDKLSIRWRMGLAIIGGARRWFFLPAMMSNISLLVMFKGGDALTVSSTLRAALMMF